MRIFGKGLFAYAVILLIAAITLCGCSKTPANSGTETQTGVPSESFTEEVQEPESDEFIISPKVTLIRPEKAGKDVIDALAMVLNAWQKVLGEAPNAKDDFYRGEMVRDEIEVLIGETNRPESQSAASDLTYYDYMYDVVSPSCVVICGGSDEATLMAAERFLSDLYMPLSSEVKPVAVGTSFTYRHNYGIEGLTLNGKDIKDYTVVHTSSNLAVSAAKRLVKLVEKHSGIKLDTCLNTEFTTGDAIFVGCGGTDGKHVYPNYGSYSYLISASDDGNYSHVIIDASSNFNSAVDGFEYRHLEEIPSSGTYNIEVPKAEYIGCTCLDETNGLVFVSETVENITDGLVYHKRIYRDANGKPVIAYVADVDLSKLTVINATPNYGDVTSGVNATTKAEMQAAAAAGYEVYLGVNADFFAMGGDSHPSGLCIKQGKVLSNAGADAWFGITDEGLPVIGNMTQYNSKYKGKLTEAVGGRCIILKDGFIEDISYKDDKKFGATRHPRTAVGITADNHLIVMVVDGRQPSLSNGASLGDLAMLMLEMGAKDALNLDGGGSSAMITSSEPDNYVVRNSPSGNALRQVFNSLVVVKKNG